MNAARPLIGRAEQTAVVASALRDARPVVVVGEVGAGKTSLVRAAAARAGLRLHEGGGFATLSWLPYLALRRAVPIGDAPQPARVAATVRDALRDGVLFVDDHHWADDATRAAVDLLAGQIRLALAVRAGEPGAAETVRWVHEHGGAVVRLAGLDRAAALALARRHLPEASEAVRSRVVEAAGGNPLVVEILATGDDLPSWLARALLRQVACLSAGERGALERLALAGRPLLPDEVGPAYPALHEAGLLHGRGTKVAIRHRLIADALRLRAEAAAQRPEARKASPTRREPGGCSVEVLVTAGHLREAVERADTLLRGRVAGPERQRIAAIRCVALGRLGRFDEAEAALAGGAAPRHSCPPPAILAAQAEASLWGGRPRRALDQATAALRAAESDADRIAAALTVAWAEAEIGRLPSPLGITIPPSHEGVRREMEGLNALAAGAVGPAIAAFDAAIGWWTGRDVPRQLACRWAAADARRRAGDAAAIASLRTALYAADEIGFEPLAARIRRSLRLAGDRLPAQRGHRTAGDVLSGRERQILHLVERGRTNSEIARRMGLGRPTVARILSNAMTKLGAQSRAHAVVLASDGPRGYAGDLP